MLKWKHILTVTFCLFAAGCAYEPGFDLECSEGETDANRECVDGSWVVSTGQQNNTNNQTTNACTAETEAELCATASAVCGSLTVVDSCGDDRTVDCGMCAEGEECQADNTCACVPQSAQEFCDANGKDCGTFSGTDNCGEPREEECGTCEGEIQCGEQTENVCGCPCLIGGECRPEGAANPDNPCETCQPMVADDGWTPNAGASCNDGVRCTENDVCDDQGVCAGTMKDCSCPNGGSHCDGIIDSECNQGVCSEVSGNCTVRPVTDGMVCDTDDKSCTTDECVAGRCVHTLVNDKCLIANVCYDMGEAVSECEICDPTQEQQEAIPNVGASCDEMDSLACTSGVCNDNGACVPEIEAASCQIAQACYATDEASSSNDCQTCQPATSQTNFTPVASGPCEDGFACTENDTCNAGTCEPGSVANGACFINGTCWTNDQARSDITCLACRVAESQTEFSVIDGQCFIDGQCVNEGVNPDNPCETCDPAVDDRNWTNVADNTNCGTGSCRCDTGECVDSGGTVCQ